MGHFRSHFLPRTPTGRRLAALFLVLFAFTQPPLVFWIGNRAEPWIGGMPFLFAYLLALYFALIGVLIWRAQTEESADRTSDRPRRSSDRSRKDTEP